MHDKPHKHTSAQAFLCAGEKGHHDLDPVSEGEEINAVTLLSISPTQCADTQTTLRDLLIYSDTPSDTSTAFLYDQWK